MSECTVTGCKKPRRSKNLDYCEMHYCRLRRNGSLDLQPRGARHVKSNGYTMVKAADHPLANSAGWVYEHRKVCYDEKGGAAPFCFWCEAPLDWETLHVDHVNHQKQDNRRENLVTSCPLCNQHRNAAHNAAQTRRALGRYINYGGKTLCVSEWARSLQISPQSLQWRLERWPLGRALTETKRAQHGRRKHPPDVD